MTNAVFWDVTPCGSCVRRLLVTTNVPISPILVTPDDGGAMFLRIVSSYKSHTELTSPKKASFNVHEPSNSVVHRRQSPLDCTTFTCLTMTYRPQHTSDFMFVIQLLYSTSYKLCTEGGFSWRQRGRGEKLNNVFIYCRCQ
jgi:hypothetical protein